MPPGVLQHLRAARAAGRALSKSQRAEVQPLVDHWADSLCCAVGARCSPWAYSLKGCADIRAKKLEGQVARARLQD